MHRATFVLYIGAPLAPSNLTAIVLSRGDTVNLTWFEDNGQYVIVYYVEVTATNVNITNMTSSQHITLTLQIGVVYSFRVRGADSINRLGEWSDSVLYPGIIGHCMFALPADSFHMDFISIFI